MARNLTPDIEEFEDSYLPAHPTYAPTPIQMDQFHHSGLGFYPQYYFTYRFTRPRNLKISVKAPDQDQAEGKLRDMCNRQIIHTDFENLVFELIAIKEC